MLLCEQWVPSEEFLGLMTVKNIRVAENHLTLEYISEDRSKNVTIRFEQGFLTVRITSEDCIEKTMQEMVSHKADGDKVKRYPWLLFLAQNSHYVSAFKREALGAYDSVIIQHYIIISFDEVIEVLATAAPSFHVGNKG